MCNARPFRLPSVTGTSLALRFTDRNEPHYRVRLTLHDTSATEGVVIVPFIGQVPDSQSEGPKRVDSEAHKS
jgi:hypothetical protein